MSHKPIRVSRAEALRHSVDMTGKNIVITGATAGVGKETARSLAKMGANICFATRNGDKTRAVIDEIHAELTNDSVLEHRLLDLTDLDSVREFASSFAGEDSLDALINNAGVGHVTGVTKQGIEKTFGTNYLGHFLLTQRLLPNLLKSSGRIVNVSSMGHMGATPKYFDMPYKGPCPDLRPP